MTFEERFWSKVDLTEGMAACWEWTGSRFASGYGQSSALGSSHKAHRVAYELVVGPIPDGLTLDHLCRNRGCVNPSHLEPVSIRTNILRGAGPPALNAAKTECRHGHPLSPGNTYLNPRGERQCRSCNRARSLAFYYRKRGSS